MTQRPSGVPDRARSRATSFVDETVSSRRRVDPRDGIVACSEWTAGAAAFRTLEDIIWFGLRCRKTNQEIPNRSLSHCKLKHPIGGVKSSLHRAIDLIPGDLTAAEDL